MSVKRTWNIGRPGRERTLFRFVVFAFLIHQLSATCGAQDGSELRWRTKKRSSSQRELAAVSINGDRLIVMRPGGKIKFPCGDGPRECDIGTTYVEVWPDLEGDALASHQFISNAWVAPAAFEDFHFIFGNLVRDGFGEDWVERDVFLLSRDGRLSAVSLTYDQVKGLRVLWDKDSAFVCNHLPPQDGPRAECGELRIESSIFKPWFQIGTRGVDFVGQIHAGISRNEIYHCASDGKVRRYSKLGHKVTEEILLELDRRSILGCRVSSDGALLVLVTDRSAIFESGLSEEQPEFLAWDLRAGKVFTKARLAESEDKRTSASSWTRSRVYNLGEQIAISPSKRIAVVSYVRDAPASILWPLPLRRKIMYSIVDLEHGRQVGTLSERGRLAWDDTGYAGLHW